jgi:hypothetical protein
VPRKRSIWKKMVEAHGVNITWSQAIHDTLIQLLKI